jgi:hypothetical protein
MGQAFANHALLLELSTQRSLGRSSGPVKKPNRHQGRQIR